VWTILLAVGLLVVAGCSRSPESPKGSFLERGDKYAAREQYREAILEYRNVLRLEPANARAMRQLGLLHNQLGEFAQAFRFLLKAQELTPDDGEVRLKLGGSISSRESATRRARRRLCPHQEPNNVDALALLADTSTTPEQVDATIKRIEGALATVGAALVGLRKPVSARCRASRA